METLNFRDNVIVLVSQNNIYLKDQKGGQVMFAPAEIDDARELVGTVWKMTSLPAMPDSMKSRNAIFKVKINGPNVEFLRNGINEDKGFKFTISDCDLIIEAMDMGLNKLKDLFSLSPQPRGVGAYTASGDFTTDLFDGKE